MAKRFANIHWFGDEIYEKIQNATDDAWWEAVGVIEEAAIANAKPHRRTGQLEESIYRATNKQSNYKRIARLQKNEVKPGKGEAAVGASAQHSHFLELGTSKQAASPFIRPAFDSNKDKVVQILTENIGQKLLRKFRGK